MIVTDDLSLLTYIHLQAKDYEDSVDQATPNLHSCWLLLVQVVPQTTHTTGAAAVA